MEDEEKNLINSHNFLVSFNFFFFLFVPFCLIYFSLSVKNSKKESPFIATKISSALLKNIKDSPHSVCAVVLFDTENL